MKDLNSAELHEELAFWYSQFRGKPAPVSKYTDSLWTEIEFAELVERGPDA